MSADAKPLLFQKGFLHYKETEKENILSVYAFDQKRLGRLKDGYSGILQLNFPKINNIDLLF